MASIATSWTQVNPSFIEPGLILNYNQWSGAFECLAGGKPQVKIGSEDLYVYIKSLNVRTDVAAGQQAYNKLPSVTIMAGLASTPTYLQRVRAEYDHHDTAALGMWNTSIVSAQSAGMRQGHFQLMRNSLLYGMNPANGEGLLNATGATTLNLPADPSGNDTIQSYDNGAMAFFILSQINDIKVRTMSLGIGNRVVILAPQRVIGQWEYPGIVELTSYQREGAGSASITGLISDVAGSNGDEVYFACDDTLIGKGAGGTDAILVTVPEIKKAGGEGPNTNEFATIEPGLAACLTQYQDMAAPMEITVPLPGGAVDVVSELRTSPGWAIRPEAITIVSATY